MATALQAESTPRPETVVRAAAAAMGTRFELVLARGRGGDERGLRAAADAACREIEYWHDSLSAFQPSSTLSDINRRAGRGPVRLDADLFELLTLCSRVRRESGGAFDPAVGQAMRHNGFHPEPRDQPGSDPESPAPSFADAVLDEVGRTIRFTRPDVSLDFGGVAKGFALDRAAAVLREAGVDHALLHGGTSSVIAIGPPGDVPAWRIAVSDGSGRGPVVRLRDAALGVSASRGRRTALGGHIIDPRTGAPADADIATPTAAVIGGSGAEADAWSTALVVLGGRPAGMPAPLTSILGPRGGESRWRIHGPCAREIDPACSSGVNQ